MYLPRYEAMRVRYETFRAKMLTLFAPDEARIDLNDRTFWILDGAAQLLGPFTLQPRGRGVRQQGIRGSVGERIGAWLTASSVASIPVTGAAMATVIGVHRASKARGGMRFLLGRSTISSYTSARFLPS